MSVTVVAVVLVALAALIHRLSRRGPVTAATVNDAPAPLPVAVPAHAAA